MNQIKKKKSVIDFFFNLREEKVAFSRLYFCFVFGCFVASKGSASYCLIADLSSFSFARENW